MRYTKEEIQLLIEKSNEMNAYALYFVDSYGYMENRDVVDLFNVYDEGLKPQIKIGFHAHNNMNLAFSNVQTFIDMNSARDLIIDSCVMGMGQGAGNLQTELIIGYINKADNKYNFSEVLNACEIIEKYYSDALWGYSVTRLLPALHRTAYKYSIALRNKYKKSYAEINEILSDMPEDLRQRYTTDNVNIYKYISIKVYDKKIILAELKYSVPLVPNQLSLWVMNSSDRLIVSIILGTAANGILAVTHKFPAIFMTFFNIFQLAWHETGAIHYFDEDRDVFFHKQ